MCVRTHINTLSFSFQLPYTHFALAHSHSHSFALSIRENVYICSIGAVHMVVLCWTILFHHQHQQQWWQQQQRPRLLSHHFRLVCLCHIRTQFHFWFHTYISAPYSTVVCGISLIHTSMCVCVWYQRTFFNATANIMMDINFWEHNRYMCSRLLIQVCTHFSSAHGACPSLWSFFF